MAYDKNTDYQAIITEAVAKGDLATARVAEQARNEKIADMNKAGSNTGGYTQTYNYGSTPSGFTGSTSVVGGGVSPGAQSIIDQMNQNSKLWYSDPSNRAQYEAQNKALGQQLSGMYEQGQGYATTYSPKYDAATGTWTVTSNSQSLQAPVNQTNNAQRPNLTGTALGDMYGLTYDMEQIKDILNKATAGEYAAKRQEFANTENQFYGNASAMQSTALDTLRRAQAAAVATGASRGMSAANELSTMLGFQQEVAPLAADLSNQRNQLVADEAAAYSKNASTALSDSNSLKQAIAQLDLTKYGYDTQGYIGELDYLAALEEILASKYASDKTLEGVKYNADANLAASQATAAKYGSTGNTYTGGTGKTYNPSTTAPEGFTPPSVGESWTPEGTDLVFVRQADGSYLVSSDAYQDAEGNPLRNKKVTEAEFNKLNNNAWELEAINDDYVIQHLDWGFNPVDEESIRTKAQAYAFQKQYGRLPKYWINYRGGIQRVEGAKAPSTPQASGSTTITGDNNQKISVGEGNYATTWTYNGNTGQWTNSQGGVTSAVKFKEFIAGVNPMYVRDVTKK